MSNAPEKIRTNAAGKATHQGEGIEPMTNEEMKAALDRANVALVDRIAKQPYLPLSLQLYDNGKWCVGGAYLDRAMRERFDGEYVETPEEAFASTFAKIAALPSPEREP